MGGDADRVQGSLIFNRANLAFLQMMPASIALLDRQLRYVTCSGGWRADFGFEGRSPTGDSHFDHFLDPDGAWADRFARALGGETLCGTEASLSRKSGRDDRADWAMTPWRLEDGGAGGVVFTVRQISDLLRSREETKALQGELATLADSARRHAVFALDPAGNIASWGVGAQRLYGWSADQILGGKWSRLFGVSESEDIAAGRLHSARGSLVHHERVTQVRSCGETFLADITITTSGSVAESGFAIVVHDVSAETRQAAALEAGTAYLQSILDTIPDAMIAIDETGLISSFSPAAQRLFGYSEAELIGRNVEILMPSPDADRHDAYIRRYRDTGEARIIGKPRRVTGKKKDGSLFPLELHVGEAIGGGRRVFVGMLRDLTEQEATEERVRLLQSDLVRISRVSAVGTMATMLAHDLNQPLTAVANYVQASSRLLAEGRQEVIDLARQAMDEAGREVLRAGAIVQRLREFISRGEPTRAVVPPHELTKMACTFGVTRNGDRRIDCKVSTPDDLPHVLADPVQVQQILMNLVNNATAAIERSEGRVEIGAEPWGDMIKFWVRDDGPGVGKDKLDRLFEVFASDKPGGMGLGMAICRAITEAHGGKLWYEDAQDGGAILAFTLPIAPGLELDE